MERVQRKRGAIAMTMIASLATGALVMAPISEAAAGTTVTVTSSVPVSGYGQVVVLKAIVADPATPRAQLTGQMTFLDGGVSLGTKAVTNGVASLSTRVLSGGDHAITAEFASATGAPVVTSPAFVQHVNLGASTTTLSTTRVTSYNGQAGALTATVRPVAPAFGIPTGWVDFYVDGSWYWSSPLGATGKATLDYANLNPGTYNVTATYTGDSNLDVSSSGVLTQTILANAPTAGLTFTPASVATGGTSRMVVSATNNGPANMPSVALGVILPSLPGKVISLPAGVGCRRASANLLYCLVSLPKGATKSIVIDVTGSAPGSYRASSYARNIDTMDETSAVAMLTVS